MKVLSVFRSPGTTWLVAVVSVPFFMLGLDLLLLPKLFPQYTRRLDLLADEMGLNRITANGPEEPWGLIFLLVGGGLLAWALKDLLFPREMLGVDDTGVAFASLLGPAGGSIHVPHDEIMEAAPALLIEGADRSAAIGIRFADASRLPSSPWGAVWADGVLFIRTGGWTASPRTIAAVLTDDDPAEGYEVDIGTDPPQVRRMSGDPTDSFDPERAGLARNRAFVGGVLMLAAALLAVFLWIAGTDTNAYYLLPAAMGLAGTWMLVNGYRDFLESV